MSIRRPVAAELDQVRTISSPMRVGELGALQHHEHVVEHRGALELERGQPLDDLVEAVPVGLERRDGLVGLREHLGDVLELVALAPT